MDSQTRHALKQDKFVQATQGSVSWISQHRTTVIRYSILGAALLVLVVVAAVLYSQRSQAAEVVLGKAIDIYSASLAQPGAPAEAGVYANSADRARAANKLFIQIAESYKGLPQAAKAHYFAGLTDEEMGQNAAAESELKTAADSWNSNLASLAKYALAGLYHQTGRDAQAINLYQALSAKGTTAVPAYSAELALADLYSTDGRTGEAKALWAKIKDTDKAGAAGAIAAQKLPAQN
uniref:Tetratricopeptide repeat-like domain-containing protein n=1 Tax=mine drainage metagenome TaxID=410659 RepID=E6QHW8_9ZZZZ